MEGCGECWVRTKGCEPYMREDFTLEMLEGRSFYPFPQCSVPFHRDPLFSSTLLLPALSRFSPLLRLFFFCYLSLVLKYVLPTWNTSEQRGTLLNTSVNDHQGTYTALRDGLECV